MQCNCDVTGSIWGCAGCQEDDFYFEPSQEELDEAEAYYQDRQDYFDGYIVDEFE